MSRRAVCWLLLLGSPGAAAGVAVTLLAFDPARHLLEATAGQSGFFAAGLGSGVGALLLTMRTPFVLGLMSVVAAYVAGTLTYLVTASAVMEFVKGP